jgi:glycosyltransferase involved in cell wall biosynthesis/O-antigen/teichoic acid export membrane protein
LPFGGTPFRRLDLHILVLTDRDWTHPQGGGTGTHLFGQVSRWVAWGHRVSVIACGYRGAAAHERLDERLEIHRVGGRSTVFPRAIWRQWRGLVPDPDVTVEMVNGITFLTPLWMRGPRVALLQHVHRDHYEQEMGRKGRVAAFMLETAPLRWLYRRSRFITISNASARDIVAHGIPREQIEVNYMGVELERFEPGERAERPTLLYLGRLKRYKQIEYLLDVIDALPEAVLEVAGDGDHRETLEREIAERGLSERVRMHGYVDEETKLRLLQGAWVNLTASSAEGWCLTVMEAGACRTPTVALAVGGLPESIQDGVTGLLARDRAELVEQTRRVVRDPALRERLGAAAQERARDFTWDRTARQTLDVLEDQVAAAAERPSGLRARALELAGSDTGRAAGLGSAVMAANVIALVFTVIFGRLLHASGYGSLAALIAAFVILQVPGNALQATVAREVSAEVADGKRAPGAGVRGWTMRLLVVFFVATAISIPLRHTIASVIGVDSDPWAAAAALPAACLWLILSVERGALQGFQRYKLVGGSVMGEASTRLLWGLVLFAAGLGVTGAFVATALSLASMAALLAIPLHRQIRLAAVGHVPGPEPSLRELLGRAGAPVMALALIAFLQNIDLIVVKHRAASQVAGSYAAASVAAKMVIWVAIGLGFYLLPEASRRTALGKDARPILGRTLWLIALAGAPMVAFYAVAGQPLLKAVFGYKDLHNAGAALPWLGLAMTLLACAYLSVQYLLALHRSHFVWVLAVGSCAEVVLLLGIQMQLVTVALVVLAVQAALATTIVLLGYRSKVGVPRLSVPEPAGSGRGAGH